jgi:hypothetical protein
LWRVSLVGSSLSERAWLAEPAIADANGTLNGGHKVSMNKRSLFVVSNGLLALGGVAVVVATLTGSRTVIVVAACLAAATGLTSLGGLATRGRPSLFVVMSLAFSVGLVVAGASIVVALATGSRPVGIVTSGSAIVAGIGLCVRSVMQLTRSDVQPD